MCLNKYDEKEYNSILKQSTIHKLTHKIPSEEIKEESYLFKIINNKI